MRILCLLPLLAAGCGGPDLSTHAGVTDAHIQAMEDMAGVIDGIHDKQSAEAARPRMEAIGKRMRKINAAEAKLPPPSAAERERLDAKLQEVADRLEPRFQEAMERLKGDPAALVLVAGMMIDTTFEPRR